MRCAIAIAAIGGVLTSSANAASAIDEIRMGLVLQGAGPLAADKEDGVGINGEILFRRVSGLAFIGAPRPHLGFSIATSEFATSQVYAGFSWEQAIAQRFFLGGGLGVAVHDGEVSFDPSDPLINERNYLGCRALFRISGNVGYMLTERISASVHVDHISNAGICSENEGLDNAGVRFGYRF